MKLALCQAGTLRRRPPVHPGDVEAFASEGEGLAEEAAGDWEAQGVLDLFGGPGLLHLW